MPRMHAPTALARTLTLAAATAAVALPAIVAHAQDAVQWRVEDGGNGHWYQAITLDDGLGAGGTHYQYLGAARALGGDLASVTANQEDAWLRKNIADDESLWRTNGNNCVCVGPMIGAFRDEFGSWFWTDGSPWDYSDWHPGNPGEPADVAACAIYWERFGTFKWQDTAAAAGSQGYPSAIVEWSADCNGDGIVDYEQILDGTFSDDDGNGVPDCCDDGSCYAGAIEVPGMYGSIQAAIDVAADGDVIVVQPGIYMEPVIELPARRITIIGADSLGDVVIDGEYVRGCMRSAPGGDALAVLRNLVFRNSSGSALYLDGNSHVTMAGCSFIDNTAGGGAAIHTEASDVVLADCRFVGNIAFDYGAILLNTSSSGQFTDCVFVDNRAIDSSSGRGGVMLTSTSPTIFDRCFFLGNSGVDAGTGVLEFRYQQTTNLISNSTFCGNTPRDIAGNWTDEGGNLFLQAGDCPDIESDCDGDKVPDFIEIMDGSPDCDGNGIPDDCELNETLAASEPRTPESVADFVEFDVSTMADARDTVAVELSASGDLATTTEFMLVYLDDANLGLAFVSDGAACDTVSTMIEIPAADWNAAGLDGTRLIRISGNAIDPATCPDPFTAIDVKVPVVFEDCNTNGVWDACEVADGSLLDSDDDGVIDDCDGCPDDPAKTDPGICGCGTPESGDSDDDGILDCVDPCPNWPYDCSEDGQTLFVTVGEPIQLAVDVVPAGGVVELGAGTHVGTGDRVVTFAGKPMTLRGTVGGDPVIIDGEFTRRGLYCVDPAASGSVVENLEIRHGDFGFAGGGAHLRNTEFTFNNCRFVANRATGPGYEGSGGGLYAYQSTVILDQCFFEANLSLLWGGGVCFDESSVIASNCEFLQNTSSDSGGGMHINLGQFTISNCRFTGNAASAFGGGFNNGEGGSGSLVDCEFDSNGTAGKGGGAYLEDLGSVSAVLRCTFTGNSAQSGGAVHCEDSDATITECLFEGNSTFGGDQAYGGAVRVLGGSSSIIQICIFRNNTAYNGGGLQVGSSAAIVRDCTFESNDASNGGGGLNGFPDSDVTVVDCVFFGNSARVGGGVTSTNGAISFEGCSLTGNVHTDLSWSGGGFHGDTPTLLDTTICGNLPDQISGDFTDLGGNCISEFCDSDKDGVLECDDVCPGEDDLLDTDGDTIPDCLDPCPTWPHECSEDGRTIFVAVGQSIQNALYAIPEGGTVDIAAGTFAIDGEFGLQTGGDDFSIRGAVDGNGDPATILDAEGDGRILGIDFGQSDATVLENLVFANGERLSNGGAIGISQGSTPIIRNCHFVGNQTGNDGGAVFVTDASPTFIDCRFTGNFTAVDGEGGGLYIEGGLLTMTGCVFDANEAGGGGGLVLESATGSVTMSTFTGNLADRGGAVYAGSSELDLSGSRFEANVASIDGGGIHAYQSVVRIDSSIVCGNAPDQVFGGYTDLGGNCVVDECGDDLDGNGIPDACDPDCDGDGIPDGLETDCDENGIPDECEIADGTADDCNANGIPDSCDIASGVDEDENGNDIPDACDVARGDLNLDGCIDAGDLGLLIALWGILDPPVGDLNGDGVISAADLGLLIGNWTPCAP